MTKARPLSIMSVTSKLSESFYPSMSILEVALRNAMARELEAYAGRVDWYSIFATTPGLNDLNKYITQARKMIVTRGEIENPGKITAELTLGFWTSLRWRGLKKAFPSWESKLDDFDNVCSEIKKKLL
jgi:hypothetical protein